MLEKHILQQEAENAIKWIQQFVENSGAKGIVIGNSGGKDSATVLAMATKAIGKENVIAISMPCNSQNSDFEDAKLVAETFGVRFIKIDLSSCYEEMEKESLSMIALFHLNYWCASEEEKEKLKRIFSENEEKHQAEIREKYNPDNLFKNRKQETIVETQPIANEVAMVEYKESIFKRFINKIKSIFHFA